jgi:hypothetical protein
LFGFDAGGAKGECDVRAGVGHSKRDGLTQSTGGSCDENRFAFQIAHENIVKVWPPLLAVMPGCLKKFSFRTFNLPLLCR